MKQSLSFSSRLCLFLGFLVVLDFNIVQAELFILFVGPGSCSYLKARVFVGGEGIWDERVRKRVNKFYNKLPISLPHILQILNKDSHSSCELFVTIAEGVTFSEMVLYFFEKPLNCSKHTSQSSIAKL